MFFFVSATGVTTGHVRPVVIFETDDGAILFFAELDEVVRLLVNSIVELSESIRANDASKVRYNGPPRLEAEEGEHQRHAEVPEDEEPPVLEVVAANPPEPSVDVSAAQPAAQVPTESATVPAEPAMVPVEPAMVPREPVVLPEEINMPEEMNMVHGEDILGSGPIHAAAGGDADSESHAELGRIRIVWDFQKRVTKPPNRYEAKGFKARTPKRNYRR